MKLCPVCDERLTIADTYDAIMGDDWTCPNGCRPCETCNTRNAAPDSDCCGVCSLAYELEARKAVAA